MGVFFVFDLLLKFNDKNEQSFVPDTKSKVRIESNHLNQEIFGVFDDSEVKVLKNTMLRLIQETEKV